MELGLGNIVWADCALGTTYVAFQPVPFVNIEIDPSIYGINVDDVSNRRDHETQTIGLNFSGAGRCVVQNPEQQVTDRNIKVNKEANMVANVEAQMETDQEADEESDQEDDQEEDIEANIKADQVADIEIVGEASIELDREANEEGYKEADVLITRETQNNSSNDSYSNSEDTGIATQTENDKEKLKSSSRNRFSKEEYRCTICRYTCTIEKAFLRHLRTHTDEEENEDSEGSKKEEIPRVSCRICGKDRANKAALKKHMLRHKDKDKKFCCDICSFKTMQIKKLIQHRRMHTGERPHLCPHCAYRSARRDNLRAHVRRIHNRELATCDTFSPRGMLLVPTKSTFSIATETDPES